MPRARYRVAAFGVAVLCASCKRSHREILYPPPPPPPVATPDAGPAPLAGAEAEPSPALLLAEAQDAGTEPPVPPECRGASLNLDQVPASCGLPDGGAPPKSAVFAVSVNPAIAEVRLGGDVALDVVLTNRSAEPAPLVWMRNCMAPVVETYDSRGKRSEPDTALPIVCDLGGMRRVVIESGGTATTRVFVHTMDRHDPTSVLKVLEHGGLQPGPHKRGQYEVRILLPIEGENGWVIAQSKLTVR